MKVVFHLNEIGRFSHCCSNVTNLLKESEVEEIRILMNGEPVNLAVKGNDQRIKELLNLGINITVCQNALKSNGIDRSELEDGIDVVPTGVFELMKRQEQGYSYIRV